MSIRFSYLDIKFRLRRSTYLKEWIKEVIRINKKVPGNLFFVFVDDARMIEINNEFLGHNYKTDVITFDYCSSDIVNGEIYLAIETIEKNAVIYEQSRVKEIERVIIHSVLHLLGYGDSTEKEKAKIREMENNYLDILNKK